MRLDANAWFLSLLLWSTSIAAPTCAQVAKGDQSDYSEWATEARLRGHMEDAIRLQRLAVQQVDVNAGFALRLRSKIRHRLGTMLVEAKRCEEAIPVFEEAAALVNNDEPAFDTVTVRSDWNERDLWASQGIMAAQLCLKQVDAAIATGASAEARFGRVLFGFLVKTLIRIQRAQALSSKGDVDAALAALEAAQIGLRDAPPSDREVFLPIVEQMRRQFQR
jgi:tetratricopeptide (TPR) repeat protein